MMRYLLLSVLVVCMIGVMVPSVFAEEELGIKCPVKTSTSNYEMIFECNKKLDVNKASLEHMFADIHWITGSFNDAKLYNIKQNDSGGTATMEIPMVVTSLKSDIKFTKSSSNYQIDFLTGKLAGSKMLISVSMTSGFDETPNMGSDVSLKFYIKKKMCIVFLCPEPDQIMYALDKGLVLLEPEAKIYQRDHPELISNPSSSNSSEQEKIYEEIKKAPEVKKIAEEFDLQPKKEYFPVVIPPKTISGNDEITRENFQENFGFIVELDRTEYTPTDRVYIVIVAPNLNRNSYNVDTIGNDDSSTITISTDRNYLTNYELVETGRNTGVFEGEITLVGDQPTRGIGPTEGKLSTYPGDELQVWMKSSDISFIITADIYASFAEIAWSEDFYNSDDTATIMVVDPDMNLNPDVNDIIFTTVYSDSDSNGKTVKLTEIGSVPGVFEGNVSFSTTASNDKLFVSPGDLLTVKFEDTIIPQPYHETDTLIMAAESKIHGTKVTSSYLDSPFGFENARVVDEFGTIIPEVTVDQQIQIITDVINGEEKNQSFAYVMTVENSAGDAVAVEWTTSTLDSGQSTSPALSWTPQVTGSYTVSLAVWKSLDDPTPLARMLTLEINVMDTDRKYTSPPVTTSEVPAWVKNNAGWWAEGQIPDSAFLQGIQFLIKEGIMVIPPTETSGSSESQEVPGWIKNNAEWWAAGQIDDSTFVSGIQYLVKVGIIKVS